ncbi:MAG TPA: zinc-dependent metalloprotease family protein, partial [Pyrinomonadaceae bacterium]|nr:zinc-dependent metalloprotease family protein [Pyrinomonadaceae bacterium]
IIVPSSYRVARLNQSELTQLLAQAPREFTGATSDVILNVPMPDGTLAKFKVEESPVMEPGLAARFPNIKTYRGQGIDDPTATARFGVTPEGFHAIILRQGGTVLIDPYAKGDTTNYITYLKRDVPKINRFECLVQDLDPSVNPVLKPLSGVTAPTISAATDPGSSDLVAPSGNVLRTYQLALAATAEYVNVFRQPGDTDQQAKERALVQMIIIMNRVNGVYERDLAIHMTLIARELDIIYTDPLTDPYTNNAGPTMITENQTNLDAVIGSPNYDIGHVFSTGGGGVATLRVPCKNGSKARGVTGLPNPTGDVFAIDYVAHEMGHQYGGNHTFNGMAESCGTPGQRSAAASVEPGSGSTIQAYAGICTSQDLQKNSDDYFHVKSLEELSFYTTGTGSGHEGNTCDDETLTGNNVPSVDAGPNYTIPKDTPFMLTAAAFDADGDALTYNWEEYDAGGTVGFSPPDNDVDGTPRPILRSYDAVTSPSRMFPSLTYILNNANVPP